MASWPTEEWAVPFTVPSRNSSVVRSSKRRMSAMVRSRPACASASSGGALRVGWATSGTYGTPRMVRASSGVATSRPRLRAWSATRRTSSAFVGRPYSA